MNKTALGIDIGGTNVKFGLVDSEGQILASTMEFTPNSPPLPSVGIISDYAVEFLEDNSTSLDNICGVGIGFPGAIEHPEGIVRAAPNLRGWGGTNLGMLFAENLGVPSKIDNDANLAALAEYRWGKFQGQSPLVLITLGTGVGGGIIIDGKILHGVWGGAAEIGHMTVDVNGRVCKCGNRGCLEAYAGSTGISARAWELLKIDKGSLIWELMDGSFDSLDAQMVGIAAKDGDETALVIAREVAKMLGAGIANLINLFNPACLLLAGGMTEWGDELLLEPIRREASRRAFKAHFKSCRIDFAECGQWTGVVGAAALVL